MAKFEFRLPDIGEGVSEGEVVAWLVSQGDRIAEDQPMVEVMTDKATVTIGAPKAGQVAELLASLGQKVPVGQVLVVIETDGPISTPSPRPSAGSMPSTRMSAAPAPPSSGGTAASAVGDIRETLPGANFFSRNGAPLQTNGGTHQGANQAVANDTATAALETYYMEKPLASPATRKLARDRGVDLRRVRPSGPSGRVLREDVLALTGLETGKAVSSVARLGSWQEAEDRRPLLGIRRKIAERMQHSKNTAAHFTFVEECRADALMGIRERLRPVAEAEGVKLTYLPLIVKAVVAALKKHPSLNSSLDEATNEWVIKHAYHIGLATATEQGLLVPVIHHADRLNVLELAHEIDRLASGARAGTLKPSELGGSTFTVTSLGQLGGFLATPVLNYPEVGILGVHQIKRKPVVDGDAIVIGHVMMLSLSLDHRIVDGHVGAQFAYELIRYLEQPERLLLELA